MDISSIVPDNQSVVSKKIPVTAVSYHGKAGQVFRLHLMNLLMNIITLGIYSFWGKTRIRRYMTSHISILDDRFEYTGTGKELLFGWMKAMLIFLPLLVCLSIPVINIPAFLVFFSILSVALYLALRYRLSRTKWRGIRFHLAGSLKEYFILSLKRTLINIFTLGFKIPKSDILLWSYIANNMSYGDLKFSYKGDYEKLRKIHLVTMSIFIVAIALAAGPLFVSGVVKGQEKIQQAQEARAAQTFEKSVPSAPADAIVPVEQVAPQAGYEEDRQLSTDVSSPRKEPEIDGRMAGSILIFYLGLGGGIISRLWYHAALWQEKFRGLYLNNLRFKANVTGGGLAKLYVVNLLIVIATLGLGKPIAAHRTLRYYATNMLIGGDLNELLAHQEKLRQNSGMGDALAADVGFDIGL